MNFSEDTGQGGRLRKRGCIMGKREAAAAGYEQRRGGKEARRVGGGGTSAGKRHFLWSWDFLCGCM